MQELWFVLQTKDCEKVVEFISGNNIPCWVKFIVEQF